MSQSLTSIYKILLPDVRTVYVVPRIRTEAPDTDYLYNLYAPFRNEYEFKSLSFWQHYRLLLNRIIDKNSLLHYHWIEFQDLKSAFGLLYKVLFLLMYKAFKGKWVWTLHNPKPHGGKFLALNLLVMKAFGKWADAVLVHCEKAQQFAHEQLAIPKEKIHIHPHPTFTATRIPRKEAIDTLNEYYDAGLEYSDIIFLFFGNIAAYKQIDEILDAMEVWPDEMKLIVAGPIKPHETDYGRLLVDYARENLNIILIPEYIPEEDVPAFFSASQALLHNSNEGFMSGSIELAKAYGLTVFMQAWGCYTQEDKASLIQFLPEGMSWEELPALLEQ